MVEQQVDPELLALLAHYRESGGDDREAWQDRPIEWNGVSGRRLTELHGELLAAGWLELNLESTLARKSGAVAACYRVTREGYRQK